KLMRAHAVRKKNVIFDRDMSGQRHLIGKDVVVTDDAVVRDVDADHEEVARADTRRLAGAVSAVKRAELANQVIVAYLKVTLLAFELYVLRLAAQNGVLKDPVAGAESRKSLDYGIRGYLAIGPNFDVVLYYGGRMNTHLQGFENNSCLVD